MSLILGELVITTTKMMFGWLAEIFSNGAPQSFIQE